MLELTKYSWIYKQVIPLRLTCIIYTTDTPPEEGQASTTESRLDDATIEQGDALTIQITGGPTANMMSLEHP